LVFSFTLAFAESRPDGGKILKGVGEVYRNVSQYELETVVSVPDPRTKKVVSRTMWAAFAAPDKYRVEAKGPLADDPDLEGTVMILDGPRLLAYAPKLNAYKMYEKPNLPRDADMITTESFLGIGIYRQAAETATAKFLREESLAVDGGTRDCFVIAARGPKSSLTLWIDKSTYYVLRSVAKDSLEIVYKKMKVNEPFPGDRFTLEPPPGARKLDKRDPDPFTSPKKR
jgi:outer membrane lipoprotein-sorting protein